MDFNDALSLVNTALNAQIQRQLTEAEIAILSGAWYDQTYEQVAQTAGYSLNYLQRNAAPKFWKLLSQLFNRQLNKTNARAILVQIWQRESNKTEKFPAWNLGADNNRRISESTKPITADRSALLVPDLPVSQTSPKPIIDWGEAPDVSVFYGRSLERETLSQWIVQAGCRLVALLGMGGIGKSSLAAKVAQELSTEPFKFIVWRSLRNAPPLDTLLSDLVPLLSNQHDTQAKPEQLLYWLRTHQCLVIFDNVETILQPGDRAGHYQPDYENYGELFKLIGESTHQSCVILTSREKPTEVAVMEGMNTWVRSLSLSGSWEASLAILNRKELVGTDLQKRQLCEFYSCNPLALKIVASSIQSLFDGDIATFLNEETLVFNGIRRLLEQQFERLSYLEQTVMYWLAINREWTAIAELHDIVPTVLRASILEVLESLTWRSLIEKKAGKYTQQPVVMEYVTDCLIQQIAAELLTVKFSAFHRYALIKATALDYISQSQSRLILHPLAERLRASFRNSKTLEQHLQLIPQAIRNNLASFFAYGVGNFINLCRYLEINLTGYDFSHLKIRQANLQGSQCHHINLSHADLKDCTFTQTFSGVLSVAFSPDGQLLATGDTSNLVQLWGVANGQPLQTLKGHVDWVRTVRFSSDGRTLISGSDDQTIRFWDISEWYEVSSQSLSLVSDRFISGRCTKILSGNTSRAWAIAPHVNGNILASSSGDGTVCLWDIAAGKPLRILRGLTKQVVLSVAFNPHSHSSFLLASGGGDSLITLWNTETGERLRTLEGHTDWIASIAFSPDGALLVSASHDKTIRIWDVQEGTCLKILEGHTNWVLSISFSPDGQILASAGSDFLIRIWDVASGQCLHVLTGHTLSIWEICFAPFPLPTEASDTSAWMLISGSDDQTIRYWNTATGQCLKVLQGHAQKIWSAAIHPTEKTLVSSGDEKIIRLWNLESGKCLHTLIGHTARVESVTFSPDGRLIASGGEDTTMRLWDSQTGYCLKVFQDDAKHVWCVTFNPGGDLLACSNEDYIIRIWDVHTAKLIHRLQGHTNWTWGICFSPDGSLLASASFDHSVKLWDVITGDCLRTLQGHTNSVTPVQFDPTGQWLVSGNYQGVINVWNVQTGERCQTWQAHIGAVLTLNFSADGQSLISGGMDGLAKIWTLEGHLQQTLNGHSEMIWSTVFSSDGRLIITASWDETIKAWDANTKECVRTLRADRPYEGMNITGATGITEALKVTLKALGAVEDEIGRRQ